MSAEKKLTNLIKGMTPKLNRGVYVFVTVNDISSIDLNIIICFFKEKEGTTLVLEKSTADALNLTYDFGFSWITLMIHSSLEAVGLTAAFATALSDHNISCNVIAGYYHDHIFVSTNDAEKAIEVLQELSQSYPN